MPRELLPVGEVPHSIEQVEIAAGTFLMGDLSGDGNRPDGETPIHQVELATYVIDVTTVTNEAFSVFVDDASYVTEAEQFGSSAVFHLAVAADESDIIGRSAGSPWWLGVRGASWRRPGGPGSDLDGLADHPAVHVSWHDAIAYCDWARRRLPTEAEWEYAARGGLAEARFPWGDELVKEGGGWNCNIWQGDFPVDNRVEDGWATTAPVRSYEPNGFGLWQSVGNVWEWCNDWFDSRYYERSPRLAPLGPETGSERVIRGGSYLCHDSYCNRYRCSARSGNTPDSSTSNMGFRTAAIVTSS